MRLSQSMMYYLVALKWEKKEFSYLFIQPSEPIYILQQKKCGNNLVLQHNSQLSRMLSI